MSSVTEFPLPELEQAFDLDDPLNTARFRLVIDYTAQSLDLVRRTIRPIVVLRVEPEGGGVLTKEYLDRHSIERAGLVEYLHTKSDMLRRHFLPSLKRELTEVDVTFHTANGVVDARLIIQEKIVGLNNQH
jgi:hypothetical protein